MCPLLATLAMLAMLAMLANGGGGGGNDGSEWHGVVPNHLRTKTMIDFSWAFIRQPFGVTFGFLSERQLEREERVHVAHSHNGNKYYSSISDGVSILGNICCRCRYIAPAFRM